MKELRVMGRATQGVRLINLEKKNDQIASVCKVDTEPEVTDEESVAQAFAQPDDNIVENDGENNNGQTQDNENNE